MGSQIFGMHPEDPFAEMDFLVEAFCHGDYSLLTDHLSDSGFLCDRGIDRWNVMLARLAQDNSFRVKIAEFLITRFDSIAHSPGSLISSYNPQQIIRHLTSASRAFGFDLFEFNKLRNYTALDFGAGIYYPLSAAGLLYANGFRRVFAYEPMQINEIFTTLSFKSLILEAIDNPLKFKFSNVDLDTFVLRLKELIDIGFVQKVSSFATLQKPIVEIGPITLVSQLNYVPARSIDLQFSNSVLEHVTQLQADFLTLRNKISKCGLGLHVVDYLDHRHYFDSNISPIEKYYDGELAGINGMLPPQLEAEVCSAGWDLKKYTAKRLPTELFSSDLRQMLPEIRSVPQHILTEHLNYYLLTTLDFPA
jgi:hypothetical protein